METPYYQRRLLRAFDEEFASSLRQSYRHKLQNHFQTQRCATKFEGEIGPGHVGKKLSPRLLQDASRDDLIR